MNALLSTTYFGPVQWYQKLFRSEEAVIEQWESFIKQTYRNRCLIATTQGVQALTVPVEHGDSLLIKDIRISNHGNWRHLHWNALQTAYSESPFFEYYQDDLRPFFERRWTYLLDFNEAIRAKVCELIDIQPRVKYSLEWAVDSGQWTVDSYDYLTSAESITSSNHNYPLSTVHSQLDFRESIRPKHPLPDPDFTPKPYYQVYQQKHGFLPNLSILDLLFNMGPESIYYL